MQAILNAGMRRSQGDVHRRAAIEQYFRQLFERARFRFVFTESEIVVDGDHAIERLSNVTEMPSVDRGKGVHVYRPRASGEWKLALDVWNSDQER